MPAQIRIVNMYTKCETGPGVLAVDTTSRAGLSSDLSPFKIGPVELYGGLGYIDARKRIYGPLYAQAVQRSAGWRSLVDAHANHDLLVLRDYDGYDHEAQGLTLTEVLNNPRMGHAFVLKMLLTQDPALREMRLRS